jgi:hypothetical protein
MTWEKLPPYQDQIHQGCPNCPPVRKLARLNMVIAVGFGFATVTKDGELIFSESGMSALKHHYSEKLMRVMLTCPPALLREGFPMLAHIEELARHDPDHDWRVSLFAPLRGREYQRHGPGQWVLVDSNLGFA